MPDGGVNAFSGLRTAVEDHCTEILEGRNLRFVGAECTFTSEQAQIASDEFIDCMKKKGKLLWANGILYSSKVPLSAGHSDDISVTGNPEEGWGWLMDKGFDIIQTDWTGMMREYLKTKKLN